MKQKHSHGPREQTCGSQVGRAQGEEKALGLADSKTIAWDGWQGPAVQHRVLLSMPCDKPKRKEYEKECVCTY